MEVVQFYFRHCGTTAALPADDLAEYRHRSRLLQVEDGIFCMLNNTSNMEQLHQKVGTIILPFVTECLR